MAAPAAFKANKARPGRPEATKLQEGSLETPWSGCRPSWARLGLNLRLHELAPSLASSWKQDSVLVVPKHLDKLVDMSLVELSKTEV